MEIAIVLFILWVIVTLLGHASWVVVRGLFRIITGDSSGPTAGPPVPDVKSDIAATRRVLRRMVSENLLDESALTPLRDPLHDLEFPPIGPHSYAKPIESPAPSREAAATHDSADESVVTKKTAPDEPLLAELVIEEPEALASSTAQQPPAAFGKPTFPDQPGAAEQQAVLSKSEVIQSFLAAHNIRWGELVAGMLIVICSIGLVISLWSPLVETHRVIPSLIFLGANGAIYAAGLYTLSRWRLRHTSRAVLVIATLLVPLSVLTGLAAAGTSQNAVQLTDPITLAAILLAGAVYACLLYLGGKALSCRWYAVPIAVAVAGPAAVLPLVPASVRVFGANAGWLAGIGSVAVMLALVHLFRLRKRVDVALGVTGGRSRLLVMAFGGFSLAVSIGYLVFAVREFGLEAMLPIAIATVPALVALAAMSRSLMSFARRSTQSMTGAVLCAILFGLAWTILPPSMIAQRWVWCWALVFSISATIVGRVFRQPGWLALATLPVGMAATLSSPVWLGDAGWETIALWRRIFGGEPMMAASLVAVLVGTASRALPRSERRTWMGYAAIGWAAVAAAIAAVLSVAPTSALGVAPWWSVTGILAAGLLISAVLGMRYAVGTAVTIAGAAFGWLSVVRPIAWDGTLGTPVEWMITTVAVAATLLVVRGMCSRLKGRLAHDPRVLARSKVLWAMSASVCSVIAATIACCFVGYDWSASAWTLAAVSGLLFWSSMVLRSIDVLRLSQLASGALAVVIGYGRFWPWIMAQEAWTSGRAPWAWAILVGAVVVAWMLVREFTRWDLLLPAANRLRRRCRLLAGEQAVPSRMPDGWAATTATSLACLGSAWSFGVLLIRAVGSEVAAYDARCSLPAAALMICGVLAAWLWRQERRPILAGKLSSSLIVAGLVCVASLVSHAVPAADTTKLVIATTLGGGGCLAAGTWMRRRWSIALSEDVFHVAIVVAPTLLAIASSVLLKLAWLDPILDDAHAQAFPTISVAAWWLLSAAALLWHGKQTSDPVAAIVSAVLAPAATALIVPVFSLSNPLVWIQTAAIASIAWIAIGRLWFREDETDWIRDAQGGSMWFALAVGLLSSVLVTISIVLNVSGLHPVFGPAGFTISMLSVGLWCFGSAPMPRSIPLSQQQLSWPIGISILAGQFAWLASTADLVSDSHIVELVATIWAVASIASLVAYRSKSSAGDFFHVGFICLANTVIAFLLGIRSEWMPWLALATLAVGGIQVTLVGVLSTRWNTGSGTKSAGHPEGRSGFWFLTPFFPLTPFSARLLGWFVVGGGGLLLVDRIAAGTDPGLKWTLLVIWSAIWVVVWRLGCPDRDEASDRRRQSVLAIPDTEFAVLLLAAVCGETILSTLAGRFDFQSTSFADPLLGGRVVAYIAVGISTIARAQRHVVWATAIGTLVAVASLVSLQLSIHFEATSNQRLMWAALPSGFTIAFVAHWLPAIARRMTRISEAAAAAHLQRLVASTWQVALAVATVGGLSSVAMILAAAPAGETQLTIVTVALAAWAIAEMAEACDGARQRHAAVSVALVAVSLWASVDSGETSHLVLTASMRWLVASVLMIPLLLFVFPMLLGKTLSSRWLGAFRRGAQLAGAASIGSLLCMLAMEATVRTATGIQGVPTAVVIGVAVTLAVLSTLAALAAILSGPGTSWQTRIGASDPQRRLLIIAAQVVGGITWLHVFLCRPDWAFVGLRGYWPYIVMTLAFISVGATEWARRREDSVLAATLSQTALYLPLLPVVGFWLSGSIGELGWMFTGGKVRYDVLLAIGAAYYIGISAIWKGIVPRVAAVVLGNAAWWVVLVQSPGWSFLAHPQAWLIPPAACVLVVAHLYRDRLEPALASAIRYAATLVIYVSSTADMLLQQIGTNLAGPVILILLALVGMAAGVILRVRPFLYLGALFVFLGVTSMVWHAHLAFDAVWPWWVFGITTGVCLLAGLMAIEKNKPKLREYANRVATWQG